MAIGVPEVMPMAIGMGTITGTIMGIMMVMLLVMPGGNMIQEMPTIEIVMADKELGLPPGGKREPMAALT